MSLGFPKNFSACHGGVCHDGVARETGYADGDAALCCAVVPLRMIFERGKAMALDLIEQLLLLSAGD